MNKKKTIFCDKICKAIRIFNRLNVKSMQLQTTLLTASRDKNKYEIKIILFLKKATAVSMNYVKCL